MFRHLFFAGAGSFSQAPAPEKKSGSGFTSMFASNSESFLNLNIKNLMGVHG